MPSAPSIPVEPLAAGEYEWIEKAGIENLKGRIATDEHLFNTSEGAI